MIYMRLRNVKNKSEIMGKSSYLVRDPYLFRGKWRELFGNDHPIYIEIGMGKGQFIIQNALLNPDINYIGIEKFDSVIARALQKVFDDIPNLKMVRLDALEIDDIFDLEIDHIYLNFSDPWPKKRHHFRRLSSSIFLEKYEKIFREDKVIEMRTDNQPLFLYSLVSFSQFGYQFQEISLDLHRDNLPSTTTEYEDKFSSNGSPIYFVRCMKK